MTTKAWKPLNTLRESNSRVLKTLGKTVIKVDGIG